MNEKKWLHDYFDEYRQLLLDESIQPNLSKLANRIARTHQAGRKIIFVGNGGSAAIASHCAVDFTKTAGIRAINFNEADLLTCFANDYGYEHWVARALECYADPGDLVVLISSSGQSPNILRGAEYTLQREWSLVTFSGFDESNPLRQMGEINFWVNSRSYNVVENTHLVWLLAACDMLIARSRAALKTNEVVTDAVR